MPCNPGFDDFVSKDQAKAFRGRAERAPDDAGFYLIWGDGVRILERDDAAGLAKVKARGKTGWMALSDLGGQSLLEFYFIDVGQGDGVLIKTPDFRHILIDAGYPRKAQPTGKSGADFVDWKFDKDYGVDTIVLDAMLASHIDFDHYGGLDDLLDVAQEAELGCDGISIESFYHAGLSHWKSGSSRSFGPHAKGQPGNRNYFTRLLGDRASAIAATDASGGPQLQGSWGGLIRKLITAKRADGTPTTIARLSQLTGWLPGFPDADPLSIRVLGPIEGSVAGQPGVARIGSSASQNSNGTSILLRVDYGKTRTLLTGDLNRAAHKILMQTFAGQEHEFACDISKSCHHGSEDVSLNFLKATKPACTVISSGDAEGHDHPRPRIVAASGLTGHVTLSPDGDELLTPLVYSTELARSIMVGTPGQIRTRADDSTAIAGTAFGDFNVDYRWTAPGALNASSATRRLNDTKVMHKLIYGLVNVRTDGNRVIAATMNEGDGSFTVKSFTPRF